MNPQPQVHLVGPGSHDGDMWHPWRELREQFPEWEVIVGALPAGLLGGTASSRREITILPGQRQAQRRSTLAHELGHAAAGDEGCQHPKRERAISAMAARRLISVDALLDVLRWANSPEEAADELWVDVDTFNMRIQSVTAPELAEIHRIFKDRENREGA